MLSTLKNQVFKANLLLPKYGLVKFTWGNVSGRDKVTGLIAIKPSGVNYDELTVDDIVILNLDGDVVDGKLKPSSDTKTHIQIYKEFPQIGGIVHTHSSWATCFAQAGKSIEPIGTTHADYFHGTILCTRQLLSDEITSDYETETGLLICKSIDGNAPNQIPAVLVQNHGPFCWGKSPEEAVEIAAVLEEVAFMQFHSIILNPKILPIQNELLDKHFLRKHGKDAYYGQQ